ncbi:RNA polymerase sigma factor SigX [Salsuginibacillus kocurii]|uniref:RNA polymerase sigma factor SigX n=1 Tax=Salsuginibacillus kocurii TaxID=427078 RepID=UPI000377ADA4|nr:RNA polymerase sigma factor SigX [Salsuginibacillus kocurii]
MNDEFDRLYEEHHQALFQFLFYMVKDRGTAEELVQDVYIKVLQSYESFEGKSSEKTWLFSIARHVGIDYIRKENRQKRKWLGVFSSVHKEEIKDHSPLPEEIASTNEEIQEVYKCLNQCTPDQQQVIILRYVEGLSVKEAAAVLGFSESKVKTTQHRALKKLQEALGEGEDVLKKGGVKREK